MSYQYKDVKNGRFVLGDCLEVMRDIPDSYFDMILCDLPYGTTQNKWDSIIPFDLLWPQYWRIAKSNAAIVLTAQPPFDKLLGASQIEWLKYEWIWQKDKGTGHLNAKKQPLKAHENILIFYKQPPTYNPQMTKGTPYKNKSGKKQSENYGKDLRIGNDNDGFRYPVSILNFTGASQRNKIHPTQKPVELFEYLIKTYTNSGDRVLDNCAGSGTTAIACENTSREWVCIEQSEEYANSALSRIENHERAKSESIETGAVPVDILERAMQNDDE